MEDEVIEVPIGKNKNYTMLINKSAYDKVKDWCLTVQYSYDKYGNKRSEYVTMRKGVKGVKKKHFLHKYIMEPIPVGNKVDHIDGNTLNNTYSNLREATINNNSHNSSIRSHNTSGYKGVHWCKGRRKWVASIRVNKIGYNLGGFSSKEEAFNAYANAAFKYHGEFARLF